MYRILSDGALMSRVWIKAATLCLGFVLAACSDDRDGARCRGDIEARGCTVLEAELGAGELVEVIVSVDGETEAEVDAQLDSVEAVLEGETHTILDRLPSLGSLRVSTDLSGIRALCASEAVESDSEEVILCPHER